METKVSKTSTKKVIPIIIAALLGVIILFGTVMGTVVIVKEARAVVSYGGVRIDAGAAAYLASTYKARRGKLFSGDEELLAATEQYIRRIAAGAYLFDRYSSLDRDDREWIEKNVSEVLEYKAGGDKNAFNEAAEPMGFDFDDFVAATELIYKGVSALNAIYGVGGSKLSYSENASLLEDYFKSYTHVKLLFVRTEDKLAKDTEGNFIPSGEGGYSTVPLTEEEKAAVAADVAEIRELIANAAAGTGTEMSLESFNSYYEKYNDEPAHAEEGYYLHEDSDFTAYLKGEGGMPNLVEEALSMSIGEWSESRDGDVICFIYKYAPLLPDYAASDMHRFFSDFYDNAARALFVESVEELMPEVKVKDSYREIDILSLERNVEFTVGGLGIGLDW